MIHGNLFTLLYNAILFVIDITYLSLSRYMVTKGAITHQLRAVVLVAILRMQSKI